MICETPNASRRDEGAAGVTKKVRIPNIAIDTVIYRRVLRALKNSKFSRRFANTRAI